MTCCSSQSQADQARFQRFAQVGQDLFLSGAITSHGGNLSETDGQNIWITQTGAQLAHLTPDLIRCTSWEQGLTDEGCSMELVVHRAIYQALRQQGRQGCMAVVHAHSLYTTAASLNHDSIEALGAEAQYLFSEPVPVVDAPQTVASAEIAQLVSQAMVQGAPVVVVKGHGPFAVGSSLEEAYRIISVLEHSCQLAHIVGKAI